MEKTGLLVEIAASVVAIYRGREWLDTDGREHEGRISYQTGLALGIDAFKEIQANAALDLHTLFIAEYSFLGQELELCAPQDTKARTSITKAIQEFDEAFLALEVLQSAGGYKFVEKAFSHRRECRYRGMPKDAFHIACAGHIARIENILKAPGINLLEKDLLKQRQENIKTAQSVYLEMQKTVLSK